jgi:DNA-directed RNA polymerase subunit beta'
VETTIGRIIFNQPIPQDLGLCKRETEDDLFLYEINYKVGKKQLSQIIDKCIKIHGPARTSEVLDAIKAQGYKYSTKGALTVAVVDASIPPEKKTLIAEAEAAVDKVTALYNRGLLSNEERYQMVIRIWNDTTDKVTKALNDNMDPFNPIYMMSDSGARGSISQIRQLAGMRGLIANTSGRTIEVPIRANYREGLNILEYFISSRGARKGLADTALRTADSGYLTRRLVDVSQEVIIREEDCGADIGICIFFPCTSVRARRSDRAFAGADNGRNGGNSVIQRFSACGEKSPFSFHRSCLAVFINAADRFCCGAYFAAAA